MEQRDTQEAVHSVVQDTHIHTHLHITPDMYMCIVPLTIMAEARSLSLEEGLQSDQ